MARNTILRTRYSVIATVGLEQALTLLTRGSFDLVLVGQLYSTDEKHAIVDKAHDVGTKTLCIYAEPSPPDVPADAFISSEGGVDHLLRAVAALLG